MQPNNSLDLILDVVLSGPKVPNVIIMESNSFTEVEMGFDAFMFEDIFNFLF